MIRSLVKMGTPQLMRASVDVQKTEFNTTELQDLIDELWENCHHYNGVGIAAAQIGIFKNIVVVGFDGNHSRYKGMPSVPKSCLINPSFKPINDEMAEDWEGCLSVPGLRGKVPRYKNIAYTYYDASGQKHEDTARDFHARIIQHEIDHIKGRLFPCRVKDFSQFGFEDCLPEFRS